MLSDGELHVLLSNIKFVSVTPATITDKDTLLEEVRKTREQGYATSFGERTSGSASISVPITSYTCPVALSILGPEDRFSTTMMGLVDELKLSAARISKRVERFTPAV